MDFKKYAENKRKEIHKDILNDLCMNINNCADCYNEETRQCECNYFSCLDVFKVTATSFFMESYTDSKVNLRIKKIAEEHGYNFGIVFDDDMPILKLWK